MKYKLSEIMDIIGGGTPKTSVPNYWGGMPIEQLQRLLGHQRIDTTLQYAMVKQSNVKTAHSKYIG